MGTDTIETRCNCGEAFREGVLDDFSFEELFGLRVTVTGLPGLRCPNGHVTVRGEIIEAVRHVVAFEVVRRRDRRLSSETARFLRRYLVLTQQELSRRMGVERETVANWERGAKEISPTHDFLLRAFVVAKLLRHDLRVVTPETASEALEGVRTDPPETYLPPATVIAAKLEELRALRLDPREDARSRSG